MLFVGVVVVELRRKAVTRPGERREEREEKNMEGGGRGSGDF